MTFQLIFPAYFVWHYGKAFAEIFALYKKALWFTARFFSLWTLARTLFSPWRRLSEEYKKGFDPAEFFSSLLVNIIMRIVGALIRSMIIIIGIVCLCAVFLGGLIFFIIWMFAPVLVTVGVSTGFALFL